MAQSGWDEQFRAFLKRAGDDLKKMGEDLRTEAQRLVEQVGDPEKQEQVRAKAREVGVWAKQAAVEVAELVDKGAQKAEAALRNFSSRDAEGAPTGTAPPNPTRDEGSVADSAVAEETAPRTRRAAAPKASASKQTAPKRAAASTPVAKAGAPVAKKTVGAKKKGPGTPVKKKPAPAGATKKSIGPKKRG